MPKYVIERDLPGAGKLSPDELTAVSRASVDVLATMAPRAQRTRRRKAAQPAADHHYALQIVS